MSEWLTISHLLVMDKDELDGMIDDEDTSILWHQGLLTQTELVEHLEAQGFTIHSTSWAEAVLQK
jgi:hypothetical protein